MSEEKNKGGRPKGQPKTGGRKTGTPNKVTATTKDFIADILEGNRDKFKRELKALGGVEFLKVFTGLLNYVTPKMQSLSVEAQISAEMDALAKLLETAPEKAIEQIAQKMLELQAKAEGQRKEGTL